MSYFSSGRYQLQNAGEPWSYRADGDIMRFEVHSGDQQGSDPDWKERSEVRDLNRLDAGKTYTISYSFMIEPGQPNTADWMMISQLHQSEDEGEFGFSPPFDIALRGERMAVELRNSTEPLMVTKPVGPTLYRDTEDLVRGKWYAMTLEVRIDPYGHGLIDIWRDGVHLTHYEGPVGYIDARGPYWKMGIYREESDEPFAIDFKGLDITQSSPLAASTNPTTAGDDQIVGSNGGSDTISGLTGADTLSGLGGADSLQGNEGDDSISGGAGADTFNMGAFGGVDRVLDFNAAEGDRIRIDGGVHYVVHQSGGDTIVDLGGGDMMILVGVDAASLTSGSIFLG